MEVFIVIVAATVTSCCLLCLYDRLKGQANLGLDDLTRERCWAMVRTRHDACHRERKSGDESPHSKRRAGCLRAW
jgi:hypothetical protein